MYRTSSCQSSRVKPINNVSGSLRPPSQCILFYSHQTPDLLSFWSLSFAFPVSTWQLGYSSKFESRMKVSSIKYLHELCFFQWQGKRKGARVLWGARPQCSFLQLLTFSIAENTLRIKFREMLSLAAVSGSRGGCTCIQRRGHHPPGSTPRSWGVRNYCCLIFIWGSWSMAKKPILYKVPRWVCCAAISTLAVQHQRQEGCWC